MASSYSLSGYENVLRQVLYMQMALIYFFSMDEADALLKQ